MLSASALHDPQTNPCGIGGHIEARFALPQLKIPALAGERIGEYLRDQTEVSYNRFRPGPFLLERIEGQHADDRHSAPTDSGMTTDDLTPK